MTTLRSCADTIDDDCLGALSFESRKEGIEQMQEPLKINPETAELLTARASARGLSVEDYLKSLLGVTPEQSAAPGPKISVDVRVKPGRAGTDPEAPDWEVRELEDGVIKESADIYENMTLAEANQIAEMWRAKKAEAEASTAEEFMAAMESLAEDVEPLPRDFSREDIYFPQG